MKVIICVRGVLNVNTKRNERKIAVLAISEVTFPTVFTPLLLSIANMGYLLKIITLYDP